MTREEMVFALEIEGILINEDATDDEVKEAYEAMIKEKRDKKEKEDREKKQSLNEIIRLAAQTLGDRAEEINEGPVR